MFSATRSHGPHGPLIFVGRLSYIWIVHQQKYWFHILYLKYNKPAWYEMKGQVETDKTENWNGKRKVEKLKQEMM